MALLLAAWVSFSCCKCPPKVGEVILVPGIVHVDTAQDFSLQARLYDDRGRPIPEFYGYRPLWETNEPSLALKRIDGYAAVFGSDLISGAVEVEVTVEVARNVKDPSDGTRRTTGTVTIHSGLAEDLVRAAHRGSDTPEITVVTSPSGEGTVAFVGQAPLGDLGGPPGEAAVFSVATEFGLRVTVPWGLGGAHVERFVGLGAPLVVPLQVLISPTVDDEGVSTEGVVKIAIAYASRLFAASRAGVTFSAASIQRTVDPVASGANCNTDFTRVASQDSLTLLVVEDVDAAAGWYCPADTSLGGTRLLLEAGALIGTTLAHELGHALGLVHTGGVTGLDDLPGFHEANLMWSYETDRVALARSRLSLGQVFRVNVDPVSFLNQGAPHPPRSIRQRNAITQIVRDCSLVNCPALERDVP